LGVLVLYVHIREHVDMPPKYIPPTNGRPTESLRLLRTLTAGPNIIPESYSTLDLSRPTLMYLPTFKHTYTAP
jgi:hypothetical protein